MIGMGCFRASFVFLTASSMERAGMTRNEKHFTDRNNVIRVLDDEKKQALFLDEFRLQVPSVGVLDAPYRCYAINHEWAKIVMGFVGWLATIAVWDGAEEENHDGVVGILKFLSQEGVCNMLQVRQSPTEPCILEFSDNDGSTWSEFADILDCITPTFLENSIINALNTNTTIQQIIDNLVDGGTDNDLPPTPTVIVPDELCNASYYIVDKLIDFIDQTITDASTITLDEFLTALLGLGGFEGSLLVLFWDFIVANSYPDLLTDIQASRDEVAKYFYCNELDRDLVILDIDASATISEPAQAGLIGAINAITDGKLSLWAFVGSNVDSGEDCSAFCPVLWTVTMVSNGDITNLTPLAPPYPTPSGLTTIWDSVNNRFQAVYAGGTLTYVEAIVEFTLPSTTLVTDVEIDVQWSSNRSPYGMFGGIDATPQRSSAQSGTFTIDYTGLSLTNNTYRIRCQTRAQSISNPAILYINEVRFNGQGFNPFE